MSSLTRPWVGGRAVAVRLPGSVMPTPAVLDPLDPSSVTVPSEVPVDRVRGEPVS
jgi:1-phosphofructokinase